MEGRRVDQADPELLARRPEIGVQIVSHQVVAGVREDGVDRRSFSDVAQDPQRKPRDAHVAALACPLELARHREGLVQHLLAIYEFDIVHLEEVDVVRPQPPQGLVDACAHAVGREVEPVQSITAALGRKHDLLAPRPHEAAQPLLGESSAVVR